MTAELLTGHVPRGIAWCPYCGREVDLGEAALDDNRAVTELAETSSAVAVLPPRHHALMHRVSRWPRVGWDEHRWLADGYELRRVLAV
jgi:hypothetical protein